MPKRKRTSIVWEYFQLTEVAEKDGKMMKKAVCTLCDGQLVYTGGTTNLLNHLETKHPVTYKAATGEASGTKSKQKTLSFPSKLCLPDRANGITNRIAEFVARDLRPFATVDGVDFKQLMNFVEPGYKVPSRTHITTTCHRIYTSIADHS